MKKIFIVLISTITLICASSCSTENTYVEQEKSDNNYTSEQKESKTTPAKNNSSQTKSMSAPEERLSITVAISNAVIVEDNHKNNVVYKKKCDDCGYVDPGTVSVNPGSFTSGFYCPDCKENKIVELKTTYSN